MSKAILQKRWILLLVLFSFLSILPVSVSQELHVEDNLASGEYNVDPELQLKEKQKELKKQRAKAKLQEKETKNAFFDSEAIDLKELMHEKGPDIFKREIVMHAARSVPVVNEDEDELDESYAQYAFDAVQSWMDYADPVDLCAFITVKSLPVEVNLDTCITTVCFDISSLDNSIKLGVYDLHPDGVNLGKTIVGIKQCYVKQPDGNYINACSSGSLTGQRVCFQIAGQYSEVPFTLQPYLFNTNECQFSLRVPIKGQMCPGSRALPALNLPMVPKPWPTPNTDAVPFIGFNVREDMCGKIWTTARTTFDPDTCTTKFCLIVDNYPKFVKLEFDYNINGTRVEFMMNVKPMTCPSDNPVCSGQEQSTCVTLNGQFSRFTWNSIRTSRSDKECQYRVWTYVQMKSCSGMTPPGIETGTASCSYPLTVDETACATCRATCRTGMTYAIGTQTCTKNAFNSRTDSEVRCKSDAASTTQRSCYKPCPVDCSTAGVYWMECPANCYTPTATQTGFWSTITPALNGGRSCDNSITTKRCSVDIDAGTCSFLKDCKVGGVPQVDCLSACTNNLSRYRTVTATYPVTVNPASFGGKACPTFTSVCDCSLCILAPTPVSTAPSCDVTCTSNDGGFATGSQMFTYSVRRTASFLYPCPTVRPMSCSKSCSCSYTSYRTLGSCFATRTDSSKVPWTGIGVQKVSAIGVNAACQTILDQPCTTVFRATQCSSECPTCPAFNCKKTTGPSFETATMLPCVSVDQGAFGGKPCSSKNDFVTCSTRCPGCDYLTRNCGCLTTSSRFSNTLTLFYGYKTCTFDFTRTSGMDTALCSSPRRLDYTITKCTVTRNPLACQFTQLGCQPLCSYVSTNSAKLPWSAIGYATCSFSDGRATSLKPRTCTTSSFTTASCTRTLSPVDCAMTDVCPSTQFTCTDTFTNSGRFPITCQKVVTRRSQYGGVPCPSATPFVSTVRSQCVQPEPRSFTPFDLAGAFNLITFNDFVFDRGSVDGRVAVGGNANLTNFDIGKMISPGRESCLNDPKQALIVQKNLFHFGNVKNGEILVGGLCSNGTVTSCSILCDVLGQTCGSLPLNFNDVYGLSDSLSQYLKSARSTVQFYVQEDGTGMIVWSGSHFEVLNLPASNTNPVLPMNSFKETRDVNGLILINVLGNIVTFNGFNLDMFQSYAQNILWNFPEATEVRINAMTLYGTILAPYALVRGSGTVVGQVVASSIIGNSREPLAFKNVNLNNALLREFVSSMP